MKATLFLSAACFLCMNGAHGQSNDVTPRPSAAQTMQATPTPSDSSDVEGLRADVQRLRLLLNQMRNNLAFVQTSQTPLKHQFELEADAWQVIVDQMDRRLKMTEEHRSRESR
jgi:hypothetical protein